MSVFKRTTKELIVKISGFFDNIEIGLLVFREAVKSYLEKDMESFKRHLEKIETLENNADRLQREIENEMITHSILPQHKEDVTLLLNEMDEIIDTIKESIREFIVEMPDIPSSINKDILSLVNTSASAGDELIPAARAYFTAPHSVREKLLKVYYFETETDKLSFDIRRRIFQDMKDIDLAHKAHLRYIINHIERISDFAQEAADMLSRMAIKIII